MTLSITMTTTTFNLKANTKTVFVKNDEVVSVISEKEYNNILESAPFFRRLGGSETVTKCYTSAGYKVWCLTSKNPSRDNKTVRTFDFNYI